MIFVNTMEIKDYQSGDEKKILELFEGIFHKSMSIEYWNWRFKDNPVGKIMIKLMWEGDILAGQYAVSPVILINNREEQLTALSMTTMTHPDYTGRGVFTMLAERLYEDESVKNDLKAVWGFPNNNSHRGFVKNLFWHDLYQIPTFSLDVLNFAYNNKINSAISIANSFDPSHENAFISCSEMYPVKVLKSVDYLNWRYVKNPSNKYDIFQLKQDGVSYFIVCKIFNSFVENEKKEVDILDFCLPNDYEMITGFVNYIIDFYTGEFALARINLWMPLNDKRHIELEKIGFENQAPVTYMGVRACDKMDSLYNSEKWLFSMGDSDIY